MLLRRREKDRGDKCLNSFRPLAWEGEGGERAGWGLRAVFCFCCLFLRRRSELATFGVKRKIVTLSSLSEGE